MKNVCVRNRDMCLSLDSEESIQGQQSIARLKTVKMLTWCLAQTEILKGASNSTLLGIFGYFPIYFWVFLTYYKYRCKLGFESWYDVVTLTQLGQKILQYQLIHPFSLSDKGTKVRRDHIVMLYLCQN